MSVYCPESYMGKSKLLPLNGGVCCGLATVVWVVGAGRLEQSWGYDDVSELHGSGLDTMVERDLKS